MKNYQCLNTSSSFVYPGAPVHVVIGMSGQDYQPSWEARLDHPDMPIFPQPERSMYRGSEFGYTKLLATREKLTLVYIGNHDGQVHDMVEIFLHNDSMPVKLAPKVIWYYMGIAGCVMLSLLVGILAGFVVRRKRDSGRWIPVQNEEA
jgi:hypothetical protein